MENHNQPYYNTKYNYQYYQSLSMGHLFRYNQGSYNGGGGGGGGGNNQYNNYNRNRSFPQPSESDYYPRVQRQELQQRLVDSYRNTTVVGNRYPEPLFPAQQQQQPPPPIPLHQKQYSPNADDFTTALITLFSTPTAAPDPSSPASSPYKQRRYHRGRPHQHHSRSKRRRHHSSRHDRRATPPHHRSPPTPSTSSAAHHHVKRPCSTSSTVSHISSDPKRIKTTVQPRASPTPHKNKIPESSDDKGAAPRRWDPYCWVCHTTGPKSSKNDAESVNGGAMLRCSSCPRSFHEPCFKISNQMSAATALTRQQPRSKYRSFVCLECQNINEGGGNQYMTQTKLEITPERFKRFFEYTMRRVRLFMSFKKTIGVSPYFPTDANVIVNPLDLNTIEQNIHRLKYTSTNGFMSDIRWLYHNASIMYSGHLAASPNASSGGGGGGGLNTGSILATLRKVEKVCEEEVSEMNTCPECYQNSYSRDDWFAVVCTPVHTLVWAKVKGFCYWPGKALRISPAAISSPSSSSSTKTESTKQDISMVDVRFFGKHDKAWVPVTNCYLISENPPFNTSAATNRSTRKNRGYEESMEELAIHLTYIQSMYNCPFPYAPDDTPFTHASTPLTNDPLNHLHGLLVAGVQQNQLPLQPSPIKSSSSGKSLDKTPKPPYVLIKRAQFASDFGPVGVTKSKDPSILTALPHPLVKTEFVNPGETGPHASTVLESPPQINKLQVGLITSAIVENLVVSLVPPPPSPHSPPPVAPDVTPAIHPSINDPVENDYQKAAQPQASRSESSTIRESLTPIHTDLDVRNNLKVELNPPQTTTLTVLTTVANDATLPRATVKQEVQPNEQLPDYESINSGNSIGVGDTFSPTSPDITFIAQFQNTTNSNLSVESYTSRADKILKSLQQANKDYPRLTIGDLSNANIKNRKSSPSSSSRSDHQKPKSTTSNQIKNADNEGKDRPLSVSSKNKSPIPMAESSETPPTSSPPNIINNDTAAPIIANLTSEPEDVKPNHLNLHLIPQPSTQPDPTPVSREANTSSTPATAAVKIEPGFVQTNACTTKSSISLVSPSIGLLGINQQPPSTLALDITPTSNKPNHGPHSLPPIPCCKAALNVSAIVTVTMHAVASTVVPIKQEPPTFSTTMANTDKGNGEVPQSTPSPNVANRAKEKSLTNTEAQSIKKSLNRALSILSSSTPHTISSSVVTSTNATLPSASIPKSTHISTSPCQTSLTSVVVTQSVVTSTEKIIPEPSGQSPATVNPTLSTILNTRPRSRDFILPTPAISSAIDDTPSISNITALPRLPSSSFIGPAFDPFAPHTTSTTIDPPRSSPKNNLTDSIASCPHNLDSLVVQSLPQTSAAVIFPPTGSSSAPFLDGNGSVTPNEAIIPEVQQPIEAPFDASPFISQVVKIMNNMTLQFQNYATKPVPPALKHLEAASSQCPSQVVEKGGNVDDVISLAEHQNYLVIMWQNAKTLYSKKLEDMQKSFKLCYAQMERSQFLSNDKLAQRDAKIKELENLVNTEIQKHKTELSQCYGTINQLQNEIKAEREQAQKTIEGNKRKQWCVACLREAVYYCCVGIWYCDKSCQIAHWEVHKDACEEMKRKNAEAASPKRPQGNFNNLIQPKHPNYLAGNYFTSFQQPINNDMFSNGLPGPYSITNHCSNKSTASNFYPFTTENIIPNISYQRMRDPSHAPFNRAPLEGLKNLIPKSQPRH